MRVPTNKRHKIATILEHPQLAQMIEARQKESDQAQEETERMTREIGRIIKHEERSREKFWVDVTALLRDRLPQDFSMEDYILEFSHGTLYTFRKEDVEKSDLQQLIEKLFEPMAGRPPTNQPFAGDAVVH